MRVCDPERKMRILILSASVGAGHVRAARAVEAALRQNRPPLTVEQYDLLGFMPGVSHN
jgi:hypothetical protein